MTRRLFPASALAICLCLAVSAAPAGAHVRRVKHLAVVKRVFFLHHPTLKSNGSLRTCPAATTCEVFKLGKARWTTDASGKLTMPYRYNDAGRPSRAPGADTVRSALHAGAAEWHRWNSNVTYSDAGETASKPGAMGPGGSCADGVNAVGWRPLQGGVLGVTYVCYDTTTLRIQEVDTALNSTVKWEVFSAPDDTSRAFDLQSVLTHELGHWLSFLDLYTSRAKKQTMFGNGKPGQIGARTLALGDVVGAQTAYPCDASDSCPRTGMVSD
jgi:hypothetical protein